MLNYTIEELQLCDWERLTLDREEALNILEVAKPLNHQYIGTDVYQWLAEFELVDRKFLEERFEGEEGFTNIENIAFDIIHHDNSYNWCGNGSIDFDFKLLVDCAENLYMLVKFHVGADMRVGYTPSILLDLNMYYFGQGNGMEVLFNSNFRENAASGHVSVDNTCYSIDGDIFDNALHIYNHNTGETVEAYDSIFLWEESEEEFEAACVELVKEHLQEFKL